MEEASQAQQTDVLKVSDIIPGLLALSWRAPSILLTMKKLLSFTNDTALSMGITLEHNANQYPNNPAIFYEDGEYTHKEFNESINRYAHYFSSIGVKKGDEVMVLVDNRPELLMIIGALSKLGAVSSLVNPNNRGEVLLYSINLTRGKCFVIGEELLDAFEEIKDDLKLAEDDILCHQSDKGEISAPEGYTDLSGALKEQPTNNPLTTNKVTLGERFAYVYTSGTTGLPKASIQTHRRWFGGQYWFGKIALNLKPTDVLYCPLPFCHTNGLNVAWAAAAARGSALAIRRKYSASNFLQDVRKYNATCFMYIGEMCRYLMNQPPRPDDADNPLISCVGNGLRPDIWRAFKQRFGIKKVYELYGAAEGTLLFTNLLNVDCTVGACLTPFAVVKYDIDEDEPIRGGDGFLQRVEKGGVGLLIGEISESLPFAGYTDKKESEKKIFRDVFQKGDMWFNFGDLVRDQGFKHAQFVDRIGDTFRWKGENVSTSEVEKVINSQTQVAGSTVYGVKIPNMDGRAGMVAVIPGTALDKFDLNAFAKAVIKALPQYAVPRFLRFMKEFETTATHKIKKTALKDEAFDPKRVSDPLFFLDPNKEEYIPLTEEVYEDILGGKYRF